MPDTATDDQDPGKLRGLIENLQKELASTKTELALSRSGYDHLSERQMKIVVRELKEDKLELTAENLKKVADEMGWKKPEGASTEDAAKDENQPGAQQTPGLGNQNNGQPTREQLAAYAAQTMHAASGGMGGAGPVTGGEAITWDKYQELMRNAPDGDSAYKVMQQYGPLFGMGDPNSVD